MSCVVVSVVTAIHPIEGTHGVQLWGRPRGLGWLCEPA